VIEEKKNKFEVKRTDDKVKEKAEDKVEETKN
jgi:hypothetical protein